MELDNTEMQFYTVYVPLDCFQLVAILYSNHEGLHFMIFFSSFTIVITRLIVAMKLDSFDKTVPNGTEITVQNETMCGNKKLTILDAVLQLILDGVVFPMNQCFGSSVGLHANWNSSNSQKSYRIYCTCLLQQGLSPLDRATYMSTVALSKGTELPSVIHPLVISRLPLRMVLKLDLVKTFADVDTFL